MVAQNVIVYDSLRMSLEVVEQVGVLLEGITSLIAESHRMVNGVIPYVW
jgi:hypothetical protein